MPSLGRSQKSRKQPYYWSQWILLIAFAMVYCIGFLLFLPSLTADQRDDLAKNIGDKDIRRDVNFVYDNNNDVKIMDAVVVEASNIGDKPWRVVESNKSFPINQNEDLRGEYIPLKYEWGTKYRTRILCLVPTLWPDRKEKMEIIASTWGKGCTKLMFVVDEEQNAPASYAGIDVLTIPLVRTQNNEKHVRNIWEKVHRMWFKIYSTSDLFDSFEWFIKADDDTFVATENLFGYLQYFDSSYPHYIGHSIRSRWSSENVVFNSGVCYVLARETIRRVMFYQQHLPTLGTNPGRSHCIDRDGAGEDPTTGICLLGVGIRPTNTMDHNMRERFLIFRDTDHQIIFREDTWFWKYKPKGVGEGMNCCSPYLISMHNYKAVSDAKHHFPILMEKYNQPKDWDNILLPPKPRLFLYDIKDIDFEMDKYLNTADPPRGQRIYKGPGKERICNRCKVGNENDPYWTEWWDGKQEKPSQHVNDAYSPLRTDVK